jgi:hypothetical protein
MPGFLLHLGATVLCVHAPPGQARPTSPYLRVKVDGHPLSTLSTLYAVAGCPLSGTTSPPCLSAQWTIAATRVRAGRRPVLLQDSQAVCIPSGTRLNIRETQMRVRGT